MDAMEILQRDARDWKRKALAAEAKLSNYRKCLRFVDQVVELKNRGAWHQAADGNSVWDAIDELAIEVGMVDELDPKKDFYNQVVDLDDEEGVILKVRTATLTDKKCSNLDVENGVVEIEAVQADEGKAIGLAYQLLQLADMAIAGSSGNGRKLTEEFLHQFAPMTLVMLAATGLLNPELGMTVSGILEFVDGPGSAASRAG